MAESTLQFVSTKQNIASRIQKLRENLQNSMAKIASSYEESIHPKTFTHSRSSYMDLHSQAQHNEAYEALSKVVSMLNSTYQHKESNVSTLSLMEQQLQLQEMEQQHIDALEDLSEILRSFIQVTIPDMNSKLTLLLQTLQIQNDIFAEQIYLIKAMARAISSKESEEDIVSLRNLLDELDKKMENVRLNTALALSSQPVVTPIINLAHHTNIGGDVVADGNVSIKDSHTL